MAGADPAQIALETGRVAAAAFTPGLWMGVVIVYLKAALLSSLPLFVSTFATSTIFTIVISFAVYLIGHLQATAREYWLSGAGVSPISRVFLALVAVVFPDLQLFNLVDEIAVGTVVPLALLGKTLALAGFYVLIYLLSAQFVFSNKEL